MKTKVTLSLEKDFVEKAKRIAKSQSKSLSKLLADSLIQIENDKMQFEKRNKALDGLKGSVQVSNKFLESDLDELRWNALRDKHEL